MMETLIIRSRAREGKGNTGIEKLIKMGKSGQKTKIKTKIYK